MLLTIVFNTQIVENVENSFELGKIYFEIMRKIGKTTIKKLGFSCWKYRKNILFGGLISKNVENIYFAFVNPSLR